MACRINYTTAWKLRLLYELSNWDNAMFLTLTYDDEHLPEDYGLHKSDLVKFFKRLRSNRDYDGKGQIRYYAVGEYGSNTKRPHYHAIVFGLCPFSDEDKNYIIDAWQHRCEDWQFDRNRKKKCAIQPVTPEDIEYVTGYVQKKLSGSMAQEEYGNRERPFAIMSKGLGLDFALQNADRLRQNGFTYINGHKISLPKYLRNKLEISQDTNNFKVSTVEQIEEKNEYLWNLFVHDMKEQLGIDYSKPTEKNINLIMRRYENWYECHRAEYAHRVYLDFKKRSRMRNGL